MGSFASIQNLTSTLKSKILPITGAIIEQFLKQQNKKDQCCACRLGDESRGTSFVPTEDIPELKDLKAPITAELEQAEAHVEKKRDEREEEPLILDMARFGL